MDISRITRPLLTNPVTKYPAAIILFPPTFLFLMVRMLYKVFVKNQEPNATYPKSAITTSEITPSVECGTDGPILPNAGATDKARL